jgi:hypothetical protein
LRAMMQAMTDKPIPWSKVPESERERLRDREAAQRSKTRTRGLPVEPISIEGLWLIQSGRCGCHDRCGPLNPFAKPYADDQTVIGHIDGRAYAGGHTINSVRLQLASCNRKDAGREATERASRKRAEAVRGLKEVVEVDHDRPEQKSKWGKSRNQWPPKGIRKIATRRMGQ